MMRVDAFMCARLGHRFPASLKKKLHPAITLLAPRLAHSGFTKDSLRLPSVLFSQALGETEAQLAELEAVHEEVAAQHDSASAALSEATRDLTDVSAKLSEETAERSRLRDENNMLRGRLRAMNKMGAATVAAVLGGGDDDDGDDDGGGRRSTAKGKGGEAGAALSARCEALTDRVAELEHENASLTAISADYRDHASEKLVK